MCEGRLPSAGRGRSGLATSQSGSEPMALMAARVCSRVLLGGRLQPRRMGEGVSSIKSLP